MNAHTPGPFELNGEGPVVAQLGSKRTGHFLITAPLTNALEPPSEEQVKGNACLLATAPQMLQALESVMDFWKAGGADQCEPGCWCVVDFVRKTIEIAKGGAA